MKILVLCICILTYESFGVADKLNTELRKAVSLRAEDIDSCADEVGIITNNVLKKTDIINGVHLQTEMQERRRKTGCFIECCLKKSDMMDESGFKEYKIYMEIAQSMDGDSMETKAYKIAHDCIQQAKDLTQHCEKGFKLMECVWKAAHELESHEEYNKNEVQT